MMISQVETDSVAARLLQYAFQVTFIVVVLYASDQIVFIVNYFREVFDHVHQVINDCVRAYVEAFVAPVLKIILLKSVKAKVLPARLRMLTGVAIQTMLLLLRVIQLQHLQ